MRKKEHLRRNLQLAIPVMITQAGQISVNIIDSIMVAGLGGRFDSITDSNLGKTALGAASLGNSVFITALVFAFGFSFAISPLVASADAKKDIRTANMIFTHGGFLNLTLGIILMIILLASRPLLYQLGQADDVIEMTIPYLSILAWSLIPIMFFQTFRQFSEGLSLTIPVTIATIIGNVVNIVFNYTLIYGNWGMPRLEVEGAAWGTFIARIVMLLALAITLLSYNKTKNYLKKIDFKQYSQSILKKITKMGIPTAFSSFFEVSAFSGAAFISGYALAQTPEAIISAKTHLAANKIAMDFASITFMICMGLSVAATVRVANQLGLKNWKLMREAGFSAIFMAAAFMLFAGIIMVIFRHQLPKIFLDEVEVISLASKLLIIAALFQLFDGIQLVTMGALRGMQDVLIPSIITFVAYWVVAIPLGSLLAIYFELQSVGVWIGLSVGLTISAIMLLLRYHKQTKKLIHANS